MDQGYEKALQVAIEAAKEAGEMLRGEFLREGGPRGHGDHAEIDEPAERVIRERLMAAFPDWGYCGEETAPDGITRGDHLWLVDPNDGTGSYLKGYRGTALSIGLLRQGIPVLGVVYAFAAPDNRGDLLAWAEGCGPIQRNGVPIDQPAFSSSLTSDSVAIISQWADHAPRKNIELTEPARYRTAPCIAYRLASVAAGDGTFACGTTTLGDWDYCGGHALLRGAGGDLIDGNGHPVTYDPNRRTTIGSCVGGAPELVASLAGRPWKRGLGTANAEPKEPYDLCWAKAGDVLADDTLLERVQGCWLGQLTGDALGSMIEFQDGSVLQARYPAGLRAIKGSPVWRTLAGQPTDDSEMALILARTLMSDEQYDDEAVAAGYAYWLDSHPFDCGNTVQQAVSAMRDASAGQRAVRGRAAASRYSQANGAMMRQSPLAIWGHALPADQLDRLVRADTTLTHPSDVCQDASAAFIVALAATIRDGLNGEEAYDRAVAWQRAHGTQHAVTDALEHARSDPPSYTGEHQGWVLVALQNAFYQALHAPTFEAGVVDTVMGGGDTDTNAAIAGTLLGAIHGARSVPAQWREAVLTCRPQAGIAGIERSRPRAFWPVDAPTLAERLAVMGQRHAGSRH